VEISLEAYQDAQNIAQEVGEMIAFEKDTEESIKFVNGDGDGVPHGIVAALSGGPQVVDTATGGSFAGEDVYELDGALPARYRARASFLAHRRFYNEVRQLDEAGGSSLWTQIGQGVPAQLLGRPIYEAEAMDAAVGAGAELAVFGDFSNFVIADRVGTTVEFVPVVMGPNGRPLGKRGWAAHLRVGSDVVNPGAFRLLTA
jgi:HK97 family phage major capsid protein